MTIMETEAVTFSKRCKQKSRWVSANFIETNMNLSIHNSSMIEKKNNGTFESTRITKSEWPAVNQFYTGLKHSKVIQSNKLA